MTSRSIYRYLLRMHPECFRKKYEDQMLWIFDESLTNRGAASLLLDALVSLVRQWVLRSGYWRHDARPPIAMDGTTALADQLRRNAETLHRRAWGLNLLWMTGAFVVMLLSRTLMSSGPFMAAIFINAIGMYWQSRKGRRAGERRDEYVMLSLFITPDDSRELYRRRIEGKRDGIIEWCHFKPSEIPWNSSRYMGGKALLVVLIVAGLSMLLRPLRPGTSYDGLAFLEFLSGLIVLAVFWRFVKKANERAAQAIQQEIGAMGDSSTPQSV